MAVVAARNAKLDQHLQFFSFTFPLPPTLRILPKRLHPAPVLYKQGPSKHHNKHREG